MLNNTTSRTAIKPKVTPEGSLGLPFYAMNPNTKELFIVHPDKRSELFKESSKAGYNGYEHIPFETALNLNRVVVFPPAADGTQQEPMIIGPLRTRMEDITTRSAIAKKINQLRTKLSEEGQL